jgi:DNA-binding NarL/FixJ family response regulator
VTASRVVIVDDQALMRGAFRTILESSGLDVVGEAASGDDAVAVVGRLRPDVVLMDVRMPGGDGLSATRSLAEAAPSARVLVLTTFDLDDYVYGALRAGAAGFLLKNASPEELVAAVRTVASGDNVLDPRVAGRVMARFARRSPDPGAAHVLLSLTEREKDVLALLARGFSNTELAARLDVSEATAKTHVSHILTKLGVRDRVRAVIYAYESGFVDDRGGARISDHAEWDR